MSTYAKLKNGQLDVLQRIPRVSNATPEMLTAYAEKNGYKKYVRAAQPEGYHHHSYKETAKQITDVWTPYTDSEMAPIRASELHQKLADTDYIAAKLAEVDGEERTEMLAHYADQLAQRRAWREELRSIEN